MGAQSTESLFTKLGVLADQIDELQAAYKERDAIWATLDGRNGITRTAIGKASRVPMEQVTRKLNSRR